MPQGLGSNPGEDMDVCKCIVPLRHEGTLNSRQAASPLVWLVEEEEGLVVNSGKGEPQRFPKRINWRNTYRFVTNSSEVIIEQKMTDRRPYLVRESVILTSHYRATRGQLAMDLGHVTRRYQVIYSPSNYYIDGGR
ncbi:hypothetical protein TNCV_5059281 [Trichonephila clavipes]|nr:hypothetical protein TNCV_5059281 [Trichonephila clavipes]